MGFKLLNRRYFPLQLPISKNGLQHWSLASAELLTGFNIGTAVLVLPFEN